MHEYLTYKCLRVRKEASISGICMIHTETEMQVAAKTLIKLTPDCVAGSEVKHVV